jgi:hypothetical protein
MRFVPLVFILLLTVSCITRPPAKPAPPPATIPSASEHPGDISKPSVYQVTPEKKQASLVAIKSLVDRLNSIIANQSFEEWKTYLDAAYLSIYSDPVRLKEYSANSPFLKQYGIRLRSLEDYFRFVVVPSRANVIVDDISFLDENRVNVWTVVDNERVLLYLLKLYGKEWKISSW